MSRRKEKRQAAGITKDPFLNAQFAFGGPMNVVRSPMAENLAAVFACVQAIASAIAALPCYVYRETEASRVIDSTHPLQILIRTGPNMHQSWPDFIEWWVASVLLTGNGLVQIESDTAGGLVALNPYPWDRVNVQLLSSGRLKYECTDQSGAYGGFARLRTFLQDEVIHLRDRTDDGVIGKSRLARAASVLGTAMATQEFASASMANGMRPAGSLSFDEKLSADQRNEIRGQLQQNFTGPSNSGKFLVLDGGAKFAAISMTPEDSELLESRRFSTEELARIYQVPPPVIGDLTNGTFTNSETAGRWFAQFTLKAWVKKLEAVLARSLFTLEELRTHSIEFDMSDLLRGDPETRMKTNILAVAGGILTPNEAREVEGWNPLAEGNVLRPPQAAPAAAANPQGGQQ